MNFLQSLFIFLIYRKNEINIKANNKGYTIILVIIVCCLFASACSLKVIANNLRDISNTLWNILQELKKK